MPSFTTEESKELNAWLAVNLLGWVHSHASLADCRFTLCWHHPETDYLAMYAPKSATSYEGMGACLEAARARGYVVSLHGNKYGWIARVERVTGPVSETAGTDFSPASAPFAVASAIRAALESETGS